MNESVFILKQCTFTPSPIGLILQFITQYNIVKYNRIVFIRIQNGYGLAQTSCQQHNHNSYVAREEKLCQQIKYIYM